MSEHRNCDADPARTDPVFHPKLPLGLRSSICPMLTLRDPTIMAYVLLHARWHRYRVLPRAGGLHDQFPTDLEALDVIEHSLERHAIPTAMEN